MEPEVSLPCSQESILRQTNPVYTRLKIDTFSQNFATINDKKFPHTAMKIFNKSPRNKVKKLWCP
jgi:hypothetical protein